MSMNAVGIDVSKRKSTVAILRPGGEVVASPFDVPHLSGCFQPLIQHIRALNGQTRIVMECTGRYYEPVARQLSQAGFFVCAVNPQIIHGFQGQDNPLRRVKTDKADSIKIARYTLDNWANLKQYTLMDELRTQLKTMNRQFDFYMKHKTAMKNNLIGLIDLAYPGANTYFDSPAREDGSQVDFLDTYWHVDCVRKMSCNAFTLHYQKWCCRKKYNFSRLKAEEIYETAKELIPVLPKDDFTKRIIKQAIQQLNAASQTVEQLRILMNETAAKLPEYPIVMAMKGVGPSLGPQLMAEIGDVARFTHKGAITAFAGADPGVNDSGDYSQKSVHVSKHGSPALRKTLYQVMDVLIKTKPDDPVYLFMDKKRAQGKPYYVYMTAGANKFLRIYYGRVKEYLASLPASE